MRNEQIILERALELHRSGILPGTGEELWFEDEDGPGWLEIPEEINTAPEWQRRGFRIRPEEKPIDVFPIWQRNPDYYRDPSEKRYKLLPAEFFAKYQVIKSGV